MDKPPSWAEDHVTITGLYAIGRTALYSLCGEAGIARIAPDFATFIRGLVNEGLFDTSEEDLE